MTHQPLDSTVALFYVYKLVFLNGCDSDNLYITNSA